VACALLRPKVSDESGYAEGAKLDPTMNPPAPNKNMPYDETLTSSNDVKF
jgi:hypothetical protein